MNSDREYLAAGYALESLAPEELVQARELLLVDETFQRDVASFVETMGLLAASDEPIRPSSATEQAILAIPGRSSTSETSGPVHSMDGRDAAPGDHVAAGQAGYELAADDAGEPPAAAPRSPRPEKPHSRSRAATLFALAASVLLVVAVVLGGVALDAHQEREDLRETLIALEAERDEGDDSEEAALLLGAPDLASTHVEAGDGSSVTVAYSVSQQLMLVTPHDMEEPQDGQDLQMWVIDDTGAHDAGLMGVEASSLVSDQAFDEDVAFGITVEPAGGSPEPTSDPIIVAEL